MENSDGKVKRSTSRHHSTTARFQGKMNHRYVCCLQTPHCCCLSLSVSILKSQHVRLFSLVPSLSMSMNCSLRLLFETFLFFSLAAAAQNNINDKETPNDLSDLGCAPPWVQMYDSCYLFSNQSGSWEKGKEICSNQSSYLVEIGSRQEQLGLAGEASFIHLQIRSVSHEYVLRLFWKWMEVDRTEVRWSGMAVGFFGSSNFWELHLLGSWPTPKWHKLYDNEIWN